MQKKTSFHASCVWVGVNVEALTLWVTSIKIRSAKQAFKCFPFLFHVEHRLKFQSNLNTERLSRRRRKNRWR